MANSSEMAEYELRQRKKEESGENEQDIGTAEQDQILSKNKTEHVSVILVRLFCVFTIYHYFYTHLII